MIYYRRCWWIVMRLWYDIGRSRTLQRFQVAKSRHHPLFPGPFWDHFPLKMHWQIDAKINDKTVVNLCVFLNKYKNRCKTDDESMKFRNLRFLVFVKSITLKSFFHMIRGTRNLSKIDKTSMQIRCSKKGCTNHENATKGCQNGTRNRENVNKNEGSKKHRNFDKKRVPP